MSWSVHRPLGTATSPSERLAIAMSCGAMGTLGFALTSPILPDLAVAFDVDSGSIGLVQAAVSIPGILFSAIIGYLADRAGRRRVVLLSLLLFTVFGVAGFFVRDYWGLIGVRFLQGIGTSGILGTGIVLIGDAFSGQARTRAMGINVSGVTLVAMIGPIFSGLLAGGGVFRPFLIFLVGFPLVAWASRLPPDRPERTAVSPLRHLATGLRAMRAAGNLPDFAGLLLATLASVFVLHGLGLTATPLYLEEVFGLSVEARGFVVAAFQVGTVLVAFRIGHLVRRFGASRMLMIAFWLMAAGAAVAGFAPTAWLVGVGLALAGVGFGIFTPQAQSFAAAVGGERHVGLTVLLWVTVVRTAQAVGPPLASWLADGPVGSRGVFLGAGVGMAMLAALWRPARQAVRRRAHGSLE